MIFSRLFKKPIIQPTPGEIAELQATCDRITLRLGAEGFLNPAASLHPRPYPADFHARLELLKLFAELTAQSSGVKDHKDLMWRFFAKMRFTPESDILDKIEDEDIIEIYDMKGDQIFRNLNYFSVVSLSVEDLVSINWRRDFKRSAKVTLELVELQFRFTTGFFSRTFDCAKIPVHIVEEMIAARGRIELRFKFISPLKKEGKCVALIVISRARRLTESALPERA